MDSGCSQHMTDDMECFSSLTPLSQKQFVTFEEDRKGSVLGTDVIKINNNFTLKDFALVDKLRYNVLSISQLVDANLDVLFGKSRFKVLDCRGDIVCGISHTGKVFQADFSFAQSSMKCLISRSSS
jgi:hypothetical protein